MNLPAVLLFICFSAAYGLFCKTGGLHVKINKKDMNGTASRKSVKIKECVSNSGKALCAREEFENPIVNPAHEIGYHCSGDSPDLCQNMKDGECQTQTYASPRFEYKQKVCCSSEGESDPNSSTNIGLIVGLSVGAVVLLLIVAGVLVYFFWYKKRKMAAAGKGGKQATRKGAAGEAQKPSAYRG